MRGLLGVCKELKPEGGGVKGLLGCMLGTETCKEVG